MDHENGNMSDDPDDAARRWIDDMGSSTREEIWALGRDASPQMIRAMGDLVEAVGKSLPDLRDSFYATYVLGFLRRMEADRGEDGLSASQWIRALAMLAREEGVDYTLVARQLDEIRRCIDGIRPFRFDLE